MIFQLLTVRKNNQIFTNKSFPKNERTKNGFLITGFRKTINSRYRDPQKIESFHPEALQNSKVNFLSAMKIHTIIRTPGKIIQLHSDPYQVNLVLPANPWQAFLVQSPWHSVIYQIVPQTWNQTVIDSQLTNTRSPKVVLLFKLWIIQKLEHL